MAGLHEGPAERRAVGSVTVPVMVAASAAGATSMKPRTSEPSERMTFPSCRLENIVGGTGAPDASRLYRGRFTSTESDDHQEHRDREGRREWIAEHEMPGGDAEQRREKAQRREPAREIFHHQGEPSR